MCNAIAGQLIVCVHQDDRAAMDVLEQIRQDQIPHVRIIESLVDRLSDLKLKERKKARAVFQHVIAQYPDSPFTLPAREFLRRIAQ